MTILYADGGVISKNPSPLGGTWAWVLVDDDDETVLEQDSGVVTRAEIGTDVTNNQMEFLAVVRGLLNISNPRELKEVRSDSNVTLGRIFKGWSITNIPQWMIDEWKRALRNYDVRAWTNWLMVKYTLIDGHPTKEQLELRIGKRGHLTSEWNVLCDKVCNEEAQNFLEEQAILDSLS